MRRVLLAFIFVCGVCPAAARADVRLTVSTHLGGRIVGIGIDCRVNDAGDCSLLSAESVSDVVIEALPDPGYEFVGWNGWPCYSSPARTVPYLPSGNHRCVAVFQPLAGSGKPLDPRLETFAMSEYRDAGSVVPLSRSVSEPILSPSVSITRWADGTGLTYHAVQNTEGTGAIVHLGASS